MNYDFFIERRAQKSLLKISKRTQDKLIQTIQNLSNNPRPEGCKKLTGRDAWRIRVNDYRIIYEIQDQKLVIIIIDIGHRRDIYKR